MPTGTSEGRWQLLSREQRLGSVAGVQIRLHWTFWLLVGWCAVEGERTGAGAGDALVWLGLVFGSVFIHELAHALVGRRRGAEVEDILLMPLGGATRTTRFPPRPVDELAMVLVGPFTSLALAGSAALLAAMVDAPLLPVDFHHGGLLGRITWPTQSHPRNLQPVADLPDGRWTGPPGVAGVAVGAGPCHIDRGESRDGPGCRPRHGRLDVEEPVAGSHRLVPLRGRSSGGKRRGVRFRGV